MELISNRWQILKRRAQTEGDPGRLIRILMEIDELLADLEARMAQDDNLYSMSDVGSRSDGDESARDIPRRISGIRSQ